MGLAGYYFVTEIDNNFENGNFSTSLTAKWNAFGNGSLNVGENNVGSIIDRESFSGETDEIQFVLG